ncbi:MAG: HEAT repeat domain-containing protein [Promethearchaeota archaeon]
MDWKTYNDNFNQLIRDLFHGKEWNTRAKAAKQLGFLKDNRSINLMCRAIKSEKNEIVILNIIEAMGRIRDGRATLDILNKLKDEIEKEKINKKMVLIIIEALARIKDKRALPYLSHFLDNEDYLVKKATEMAFDSIEPRWREIIEKEQKKKTPEEIFKSRISI